MSATGFTGSAACLRRRATTGLTTDRFFVISAPAPPASDREMESAQGLFSAAQFLPEKIRRDRSPETLSIFLSAAAIPSRRDSISVRTALVTPPRLPRRERPGRLSV